MAEPIRTAPASDPCVNDTNGDGDCGRTTCARCHPEMQPAGHSNVPCDCTEDAVEVTPPVDTSWITYEPRPSGLFHLLVFGVLCAGALLAAASSIWLVLR